MDKSHHGPECMLAHTLIDRLANLVNYCDLLQEEAEAGSALANRVGIIQRIARGAIEELNEHQRKLSEQLNGRAGGDKVA